MVFSIQYHLNVYCLKKKTYGRIGGRICPAGRTRDKFESCFLIYFFRWEFWSAVDGLLGFFRKFWTFVLGQRCVQVSGHYQFIGQTFAGSDAIPWCQISLFMYGTNFKLCYPSLFSFRRLYYVFFSRLDSILNRIFIEKTETIWLILEGSNLYENNDKLRTIDYQMTRRRLPGKVPSPRRDNYVRVHKTDTRPLIIWLHKFAVRKRNTVKGHIKVGH